MKKQALQTDPNERREQHRKLAEGDLARFRRARLARHTPLVKTVTNDTQGIVWHTAVVSW